MDAVPGAGPHSVGEFNAWSAQQSADLSLEHALGRGDTGAFVLLEIIPGSENHVIRVEHAANDTIVFQEFGAEWIISAEVFWRTAGTRSSTFHMWRIADKPGVPESELDAVYGSGPAQQQLRCFETQLTHCAFRSGSAEALAGGCCHCELSRADREWQKSCACAARPAPLLARRVPCISLAFVRS